MLERIQNRDDAALSAGAFIARLQPVEHKNLCIRRKQRAQSHGFCKLRNEEMPAARPVKGRSHASCTKAISVGLHDGAGSSRRQDRTELCIIASECREINGQVARSALAWKRCLFLRHHNNAGHLPLPLNVGANL